MAHPMNNELVLGRVIENQIGIGRSHHASKAALACKLAGMGMLQLEIDDGLNARLDMTGTLRRARLDIDLLSSAAPRRV